MTVIKEKGIEPDQRIFPITYNAARVMVKKAGKAVGIHLRPHDLRRFCATYASRAGTPIEIISIMFPSILCSLLVFSAEKKHHSPNSR